MECKGKNEIYTFLSGLEIIETYWNVKSLDYPQEIKSVVEIIETYWNVKCVKIMTILATYIEIIETYWNVKSVVADVSASGAFEIIETYWNVKIQHHNWYHLYFQRNNRNILECKAPRPTTKNISSSGGNNRNILECKEEKKYMFEPKICEIIETYWNVKDVRKLASKPLSSK